MSSNSPRFRKIQIENEKPACEAFIANMNSFDRFNDLASVREVLVRIRAAGEKIQPEAYRLRILRYWTDTEKWLLENKRGLSFNFRESLRRTDRMLKTAEIEGFTANHSGEGVKRHQLMEVRRKEWWDRRIQERTLAGLDRLPLKPPGR